MSTSSTISRTRTPITFALAGACVSGAGSSCAADEVAVGIFHDYHARRMRAARHRHRHAAASEDGRTDRLDLHERRIDVAHQHDQHERAGILQAAVERLTAGARNLHDLDTRARRGRPRDLVAQLRFRG